MKLLFALLFAIGCAHNAAAPARGTDRDETRRNSFVALSANNVRAFPSCRPLPGGPAGGFGQAGNQSPMLAQHSPGGVAGKTKRAPGRQRFL